MTVFGATDRPVLAIGRAGMDFYADPPGVEMEQAAQFTAALGGSSANIAAGLSKLGHASALLSCVSDDAVGRYCLGQLDHYGVNRDHVHIVGGEARTSLAVVETRLENCQSVIYRNGAADFELTPEQVNTVDYATYGAVVATGTALAAEPSRGAVFVALDRAKAAGVPIVIDLDYRPYSWPSAKDAAETYKRAAASCACVVGNDVEFDVLANTPGDGLEAARELAAKGALVVYKMGEKGAVTLFGGEEIRTGIFQVEALKPTGAGDAFMAGFLATLLRGEPLREALVAGSAAAAITVSRVACAPAIPNKQELAAFLAERPQGI